MERNQCLKYLKNLKNRHYKALKAQTYYPGAKVAKIEFTSINTFLLTTSGKVLSWGGNSKCLGREVNIDNIKEAGEVVFSKNKIVTNIAAGKSHILALTSDHLVYSWGKNDKGQLGLGK